MNNLDARRMPELTAEPATDISLSGIDASNATARFLLGNSKSHSWLQQPTPGPIASRGHPNTHAASNFPRGNTGATRAKAGNAQGTAPRHIVPKPQEQPSSNFVPATFLDGIPAPALQQSDLHSNTTNQRAPTIQSSATSHDRPQQNRPQRIPAPDYSQTTMLQSARLKLKILSARDDLTPVDRRILDVLREAVNRSDIFYLILHQSLMRKHKSGSPTIILRNIILDDTTMTLLQEILAIRSEPSPSLRVSLQDFPLKLLDISQVLGVERTSQALSAVGACCNSLKLKWEQMIHFHAQQSCLPLAQDLEVNFEMSSVCLQRLTFLAVMRRCWKTTTSIPAQHAYSYFLKEQREFITTKIIREPEAHYLHYRYLFDLNMRLNTTGLPSPASFNSAQSLAPNLPQLQHESLSYTQTNFQNLPCMQRGSLSSTQSRPRSMRPLGSSGHQSPDVVNGNLTETMHQSREASISRAPRATHFIPTLDMPAVQAAQPNPLRYGLHQVHLNGPELIAKPEHGRLGLQPVLFRHVSGFALVPRKLTLQPIEELAFSISQEQLDRLPTHEANGTHALVDSSTISFRLRCCKLSAEEGWVTAECTWPSYLYFTLNGHPLDLRRKLQHGKCMPVDLDQTLRLENILKVYANLPSTVTIFDAFVIGVEVVQFTTKDALKKTCSSGRTRPAEETRQSIMSSLSKSGVSDDGDEVTILQSNVTISLLERFTNAKIWDIPIRGVDCTHREAFDLETFLDTRPLVGESAKVSEVDQWRCPICRGDARPTTWIVDGFLQEVQVTLAAAGSLNVRSITVESNGAWKANYDTTNRSHGDHETMANGGEQGAGLSQTIIEIDSD